MTQPSSASPTPSAESADSAGEPGYSGSVLPRLKRIKRDVFGPPARRWREGRQRDPVNHPMLQLNASGQSVERCGVCLMTQAHCAC